MDSGTANQRPRGRPTDLCWPPPLSLTVFAAVELQLAMHIYEYTATAQDHVLSMSSERKAPRPGPDETAIWAPVGILQPTSTKMNLCLA